MNIKFGNLTMRQFADKVQADFTDEELETLEGYRTDIAEFTDPGKFHIFDDPAISINIGSECIAAGALGIFTAANTRKTFTGEVAFYPNSRVTS